MILRLRFVFAWSLHRIAQAFANLGNAILFGPRTSYPPRERTRP